MAGNKTDQEQNTTNDVDVSPKPKYTNSKKEALATLSRHLKGDSEQGQDHIDRINKFVEEYTAEGNDKRRVFTFLGNATNVENPLTIKNKALKDIMDYALKHADSPAVAHTVDIFLCFDFDTLLQGLKALPDKVQRHKAFHDHFAGFDVDDYSALFKLISLSENTREEFENILPPSAIFFRDLLQNEYVPPEIERLYVGFHAVNKRNSVLYGLVQNIDKLKAQSVATLVNDGLEQTQKIEESIDAANKKNASNNFIKAIKNRSSAYKALINYGLKNKSIPEITHVADTCFSDLLNQRLQQFETGPDRDYRLNFSVIFYGFRRKDYNALFDLMRQSAATREGFGQLLPSAHSVFQKFVDKGWVPDDVARWHKKYEDRHAPPSPEQSNDNPKPAQKELLGIPLTILPNEVLERKDEYGEGDPKGATATPRRLAEANDNNELAKLNQLVNSRLLDIEEIIVGKKPTHEKKPHYHVLRCEGYDETTVFVAVADNGGTYILHDPNFDFATMSMEELLGHPHSYNVRPFKLGQEKEWCEDVKGIVNSNPKELGFQNLNRDFWRRKKNVLMKAFTQAVLDENGIPPKLSDKIDYKKDPSIHGKTWNAAATSARKNNIIGLEHINTITELAFEAAIMYEKKESKPLLSDEWLNSQGRREKFEKFKEDHANHIASEQRRLKLTA